MPAVGCAWLKVAIEAVDRDDEKDTDALYNPNLGEVITTTRMSTKAHVDMAVDVATQAYQSYTRWYLCAYCPVEFSNGSQSWKLAPALAAGCTVLLKPSEVTLIQAGRI